MQTSQLRLSPPAFPKAARVKDVPFFPQPALYCGPTTLAEVFSFYGEKTTPEAIAPEIFIPELEGSLQIEMTAAARAHGFLAYNTRGSLTQLFELVNDGIPVVVLQNLGLSWLPSWHYALVTGYDLQAEEVIMHSGEIEDYRTEFSVFERTWQRAEFWLLAIVPVDKASQQFEPFVYTRAAQDLIATGQQTKGQQALLTAHHQWPDYWLPYFLLANQHLSGDLAKALHWYQKGLPFAAEQAGYFNNYAYALSQSGCQKKAEEMIQRAKKLAPGDSNIEDTRQAILAETTAVSCRQFESKIN